MAVKTHFPVLPTATIPEIPLYLIPRVVADQIRANGETVFQITVTRTHCHFYTVSVSTSAVRKAPPNPQVDQESAVLGDAVTQAAASP